MGCSVAPQQTHQCQSQVFHSLPNSAQSFPFYLLWITLLGGVCFYSFVFDLSHFTSFEYREHVPGYLVSFSSIIKVVLWGLKLCFPSMELMMPQGIQVLSTARFTVDTDDGSYLEHCSHLHPLKYHSLKLTFLEAEHCASPVQKITLCSCLNTSIYLTCMYRSASVTVMDRQSPCSSHKSFLFFFFAYNNVETTALS